MVELSTTNLTEDEYKVLKEALRNYGVHLIRSNKEWRTLDSMARKLIGFNWNGGQDANS